MPKLIEIKGEPKYVIDAETGQVYNRITGNPIPLDEPVVLFRAQDRHLPAVLEHYQQLCTTSEEEHRRAIQLRLDEVVTWQQCNPLRVKTPDTILDEHWPGV